MEKLTKQNPDLGLVLLPGYDDERGKSVCKHIQTINNPDECFRVGIKAERFGNGEGTVAFAPNEPTVRGKHLVFIADTTNYDSKYTMYGFTNHRSPDDHFADLKSGINAAAGKAKKCTVVMPHLYRSREDKRGYRGSLDCARALQELEKLGVENIITVDVHNPAIQNAIPNISFDNILPSYPILKAVLKDEYSTYMDKKIVTISPDEGHSKQTSAYASMLSSPMGLFHKERDFTKFENGTHPITGLTYTGCNVEGKTAIIFDDILGSGRTLEETARKLRTPIDKGGLGAKRVLTITTHGLFNNGPEGFDRAVEDGIIERVYVTNSAYLSQEVKSRSWLKVVDITEEIAETINALDKGESMTPFVRGSEKIKELLTEMEK